MGQEGGQSLGSTGDLRASSPSGSQAPQHPSFSLSTLLHHLLCRLPEKAGDTTSVRPNVNSHPEAFLGMPVSPVLGRESLVTPHCFLQICPRQLHWSGAAWNQEPVLFSFALPWGLSLGLHAEVCPQTRSLSFSIVTFDGQTFMIRTVYTQALPLPTPEPVKAGVSLQSLSPPNTPST